MITKTRKQGNSIMLTVPKDFNVPNGVEVEAKLVENGILYEFVEPQKEFYDFSEDILSDIIAEGYDKDEILVELKRSWQQKLAYEIVPSKHVIKYLKKLKEKPLKEKFLNLIYDEIAIDPYKGEQKTGDLSGIWSSGFKYAGTTYRVAYEIIENKVIPVLLCGTHENFYEQLKKLI